MDYSLLLGIHDIGRAEREDDVEEASNEEEQEAENGLAAGTTVGSYGTSPEGIAGYMSSCKPLGPGEFDPYVDVYAIGSCAGKWPPLPFRASPASKEVCDLKYCVFWTIGHPFLYFVWSCCLHWCNVW